MTPTDSADAAVTPWERHFREPERAFAQASELASSSVDARVRAWSELTIAYHDLYFTANPLEA